MKLFALIFVTLLFSCYHAAELDVEYENEDAFSEVTAAPSGGTVGKIINVIQAIGSVLEKILTQENIAKIMQFGKAVFDWGKAIIEQVKQLRNVTSVIKGKRNAELVRKEMNNLHAKMDNIDREFDTIKTAIDWNVLKVKMTEYEGAIKSLDLKLKHYLEAPQDVSETYKKIFIEAYEQHFADAPLKIYYTMTVKNSLFNKNLFEIARKQFKNDIRDVSKLAGYLIRLIQKGLEVQLAYYGMVDLNSRIPALEEEWEERFDKLEELGKEIDEKIEDSWHTQSFLDLDAAVKASEGTTNDKLATQLYKQVSEKYKWRQWYVLVYKYTSSEKESVIDNCNGFGWANVADKTVVVNSVPSNKTSPRIAVSKFFNAIPATVGKWSPFANAARRLYDMVPSSCDEYTFKGVIHSDAEVQVRSAEGRSVIRSVAVRRYFKSTKHFMLTAFD